jgi:uncharacterized protein YgbK (DUF1537 family)
VTLLAYYGDDFTGSTDVLEALTTSGVPTALFTEPPREEMLERFPDVRAIGIAGNSRTMSPAEMEQALPAAFESLAARSPGFVHYKVCSTFDSSPQVGSIGRAIEIGQRIYQNRFVPLVVGAPGLQRFCVFGNLFARSGLDSPAFRLDRHPTMRHHPVTPMTEADLRIHLSHQTDQTVQLVDVLTLNRGAAAVMSELPNDGRIVLFDAITDEHLGTIGEVLCEVQRLDQKPLFVAGSSGIEYALCRQWRKSDEKLSEFKGPPARSVDRALVISGSCSPVTGRQIDWALERGYVEVPVDPRDFSGLNRADGNIAALVRQVVQHFKSGRSVIVHTSRGPHDERLTAARLSSEHGLNAASLGDILGRILSEVLQATKVDRVAVAGGDTSGAIARAIGIEALTMLGPLAPGAPLSIADSRRAEVDGVEFTFKGGQVGYDDFFGSLLSGGPSRSSVGD